jgi:hypothetical protein
LETRACEEILCAVSRLIQTHRLRTSCQRRLSPRGTTRKARKERP